MIISYHSKSNRCHMLFKSLAIVAGFFALGLTASPAVAADEEPPAIKLGMVAPFTGSGAEYGAFYQDAAALAVEHLNAAATEVFGGPIIAELYVEDAGTLPTVGIAAARKLVSANGVPALIGPWSSGVTTAIAESVTIPNGVLHISNAATSPLISVLPADQEADLVFRTTTPDTVQGMVAAQLAAGEIIEESNYETASTIYLNNPYGQGLSNAFVEAFEARGGEVLAEVPHPGQMQPSYRAELSAALEGDPDLLFLPTYAGHTATIVQEARDFFDMTTFQFTDGNQSTQVLEAAGAETLAGSYGTSPGQDPAAKGYQQFAQAYEEQFGRKRVPPFTVSAYDAAIVIGLAAAKAVVDGHGSADEITGAVLAERVRPVSNPPGEEILGGTVEGITKAMQIIKQGEELNYKGASGAVDFDEYGDVVTPIEIWQFTSEGTIEAVTYQGADEITDQ